jgi:hypothetical protein
MRRAKCALGRWSRASTSWALRFWNALKQLFGCKPKGHTERFRVCRCIVRGGHARQAQRQLVLIKGPPFARLVLQRRIWD